MKSDEAKAIEAQTKILEGTNRELKKISSELNKLNTNIVEALAALRPKEETQDASSV